MSYFRGATRSTVMKGFVPEHSEVLWPWLTTFHLKTGSPVTHNTGNLYVRLQLYTGRAKKRNPLGKIRYLWNCSKFFHRIYSIYRGGFRPRILQISLQYLVAFKYYTI